MGHYAKVVNGIVEKVIVAKQDFIQKLPNPETWVKTSYNTRGGIHYAPDSDIPDDGVPLRKNFAGIGYTYDSVRDAFIPPKPFESWILNEDTCFWEPPVPYPNPIPELSSNQRIVWNEEKKEWWVEDVKTI